MSDKEIIYYRITDQTQIKDVLKELLDAGIECKNCMMKNQINTKNVIIKLIVIPIGHDHMNYVRGLCSVGCFGFSDEVTDYITRGKNICEGFELVDYVRDMNII